MWFTTRARTILRRMLSATSPDSAMPWISSSPLTWSSPKTSVRRWILSGESASILSPTSQGRPAVGWFDQAVYGAYRERLYYTTGFGLIQCVKALMSYEDEVTHSTRPLRERQVNLYEGSASSTNTYKAQQRHRESTQEEERVFTN